jgi:hypothetical protein
MRSPLPPRTLPLIPDLAAQDARPGRDTFVGLHASDRGVREEILHRAYAIWESQGHPEGRELANWLEAETEILPRG